MDMFSLYGEQLIQLKLLLEHRILTDSEAGEISEKYSIPINKFPKIYSSDPQIIKIGGAPGRLVAINREDPTGKYTYYRYIIEG